MTALRSRPIWVTVTAACLITGLAILTTNGVILAVVGLVLMLLGRSGRTIGGRAHYW